MWQLVSAILLLTFLYCVAYLYNIRNRPGLKSVPGPLFASFSDVSRIISCAKGHQMNYHLELHRKYGPLVRVGPNCVSFADCSLIPHVYSITSNFYKVRIDEVVDEGTNIRTRLLTRVQSDFYIPFDIKTPDGMRSTIFSVRDEHLHRDIRRPIANAYALSSLKELEPMNDSCSNVIMRKFEGLVGKDIDLGKWVHWYAFDVITSITFSHTMGMLEKECDVENIIEAIEGRLIYNSVIGQSPWLHGFLFGNEFVQKLANLIPAVRVLNSSKYIVAFAAKQLKRYENQEFNTVPLRDMLDRLKRFKDDEQLIDDARLLSHATSNIFAGSDTTASSLRALFYYICRNKTAHARLLAEIDEADRSGRLSNPVTFTEAQRLGYLQAVIKEALRMHPAVGMLLERVVPKGGAQLGGVWFPEGTVVGMNPWVAARDKSTYGDDAFEFRPERWLEANEQQLRLMERNFLAFGAGARACLGKNISILEMSKLVPQLYRRFDFELSDPSKEWTLHDYWFVKQSGLTCRVIRRDRD